MARIKKGSRHIVLLAAFLAVMSAAGGLVGVVTAAIFILLMSSTFHMSAGITEFMIAMVVVGMLIASVLGLMLTVEWPQRLFTRSTKSVPTVAQVAVTVASSSDGN